MDAISISILIISCLALLASVTSIVMFAIIIKKLMPLLKIFGGE